MVLLLKNTNKMNDHNLVPLVPLREGVVFPHTEVVLTFGRPKSLASVKAAFEADRLICFVAQKNPRLSDPKLTDLYKIGTLCTIQRILKTDNEVNALVKGMTRVKIESIKPNLSFYLAQVSEVKETSELSEEVEALTKHLSLQLKKAVNLGKPVDFLTFMRLMSEVSAAELTDQIASLLDVRTDQKQKILEIPEVEKRLSKVIDLFSREMRILEIERLINAKTQKKFDKSMRETILRERMKTIQKELGEEEEDRDIIDLRKKIKIVMMPRTIEEKALKELDRLAKMHSYNPEGAYIRTYLDWLIDMPWSKKSPNNVSLRNAKKVLEADHYGLKEVKERVLEYLAVMKLKKEKTKKENHTMPTIICFVGPPGVGKTSIAKSIARSLGRKFVKVSLGGIRDEAEIRGHRRTYVGAMPGRILQGIKDAGTKNPVFVLDEIDKVGADFRGDPSSALLEALDPEQNKDFSDHYLEVPFDLSEVMFITTANILDTIPPALKDRLEVIRFSGYTQEEKLQIAKKFLLKKVLGNNALDKKRLEISEITLSKIIENYTREAGVRNLEREISKIARKAAREIVEKGKKAIKVGVKKLEGYLGPETYTKSLAEKQDEVGVTTGLAWTQAGGDILFIEVVLMPGKGNLILTGKLGDVMKESCRAALSYLRSHWQQLGIKKDETKNLDIHIHVPEGAVPKDGPSAGVAIASSLASALMNKKVRKEIGMTGEITLRGKVLEIGGVKEKMIAAHRAGLKKVILPKGNKKDLIDLPQKVKKEIDFVLVDNLNQVLKEVLVG